MNRKLSRLAAAGIIGFALFTGSFSASAAPAWSLPESGLQMDNASKQAYIYKEMYASFHPAKDAKPVSHPFEVPDDWTYTRFDMGSFYMEKLVNPKGSPNRTSGDPSDTSTRTWSRVPRTPTSIGAAAWSRALVTSSDTPSSAQSTRSSRAMSRTAAVTHRRA